MDAPQKMIEAAYAWASRQKRLRKSVNGKRPMGIREAKRWRKILRERGRQRLDKRLVFVVHPHATLEAIAAQIMVAGVAGLAAGREAAHFDRVERWLTLNEKDLAYGLGQRIEEGRS